MIEKKNGTVMKAVMGGVMAVAIAAGGVALNVWRTQAVLAEEQKDIGEYVKEHTQLEKEQAKAISKVDRSVVRIEAEQKSQRRILERIARKVSD